VVRTPVMHNQKDTSLDALSFPATGKQFETVSANIGVVRDGKAVEHWSEGGVLAMLQQVGVIPQMEPPTGLSAGSGAPVFAQVALSRFATRTSGPAFGVALAIGPVGRGL
jgi:hypothetical protein